MVQIAAMLTAALMFVAAMATADAAGLRAEAVIEGEHVRLGDLFEDLPPARAEIVIARAPSYGRAVTLQADWVRRVARAYSVDYRPDRRGETIVLRRAGKLVPEAAVEAALMAALEDRLPEGRIRLTRDGAAAALYVPDRTEASVAVATFRFEPVTGQFSAELVAPAAGDPVSRATVGGQAEAIVDIPVPARRLRAGEVIATADLAWIELPARQIRTDIAMAEDELLGMSPRRTLAPERPVRLSEIRPPVIVARGASVRMRFVSGPLVITAIGRALQDGADGEIIRVVNIDSSRTIEAVVSGPDTVTALTGSAAAVARSVQEANP
ncbi:MAG: flagellar basal body P-ring formation protein FlgA [Alphaproteobacteria bacterium]|jgi:flagella basal body P-ring formation protein FlgA|nr:flagellar basal body P-ring formation protein FlgA [Alphaproteobacteria bacterium]